MHKLDDDDLYWIFRPVIHDLTPERLNMLKSASELHRSILIGKLIDALRRGGLDVLSYHDRPFPDTGSSVARAVVDALCHLTDRRDGKSPAPQLPLSSPVRAARPGGKARYENGP